MAAPRSAGGGERGAGRQLAGVTTWPRLDPLVVVTVAPAAARRRRHMAAPRSAGGGERGAGRPLAGVTTWPRLDPLVVVTMAPAALAGVATWPRLDPLVVVTGTPAPRSPVSSAAPPARPRSLPQFSTERNQRVSGGAVGPSCSCMPRASRVCPSILALRTIPDDPGRSYRTAASPTVSLVTDDADEADDPFFLE